jgi:UDP-glucose 4-epimerase
MKSFLVTGGCGFIGRRVVESLLSRNANFVRVVDNLSDGKPEILAQMAEMETLQNRSGPPATRLQLVVGDVRDENLAVSACEGVDAIVHLAANTGVPLSIADPRTDCISNVIGTFNYLEAARQTGVTRFVFASSAAAAGDCEPPVHEKILPRPISPYGVSKLAGEAYCGAYAAAYGITTVALRFGNVYGPGSAHKQSVVAKFIRHAFAGEAIPIYGDGTQVRDFIYVDDLVDAIHRAIECDGIAGELFQIATSKGTSVLEIAQMLNKVIAAEGITPVQITFQSFRSGDVMRNFADTSKAQERLGWRAKVELFDGLQRTVRWARDQYGT